MIFHSFFVNVYQRVNHIQCWDHFTCGCQAVFKAHFSDIGSMIPAESLGELHFFSSNFGSPWAILRFWPTASRQIRSAPSSRPAGGYLCGLSSRRSGAYLGSESASHWTRWTFSLIALAFSEYQIVFGIWCSSPSGGLHTPGLAMWTLPTWVPSWGQTSYRSKEHRKTNDKSDWWFPSGLQIWIQGWKMMKNGGFLK